MSSQRTISFLVGACLLIGCGGAETAGGPDAAPGQAPDALVADAAPGGCDGCGDLGCCGDHCCALVPSNGDVVGGLAANGLSVGASGTFDTSAQCVAPSLLGACEPVTGGSGPDLCVCRADEVVLGDLTVTGGRGLVILASARIRVDGRVVLLADSGQQGPGARRRYFEPAEGMTGGTGGSHGSAGGRAGAAATWGNPALVPLEGGMSGQDTCGDRKGGGGGGALQLTAGERIIVAGAINAGGAGGDGGDPASYCGGAAGGGSGGAVLIEAPAVELFGAVAANGGGGGGGGGDYSGGGGHGAKTGSTPAEGGEADSGWGCQLNGYTSGGWGGHGAVEGTAAAEGGPSDWISGCLGGTHYLGEGGGGGGVGRIRINTSAGCQCTGSLSPAASLGALDLR